MNIAYPLDVWSLSTLGVVIVSAVTVVVVLIR